MVIELDQAAVEAAAKATKDYCITDGDIVDGYDWRWDTHEPYWIPVAESAIRAYQAAMAPQVREAVDELLLATDMKCIYQQDGCLTDDATVNEKRVALLALVGASEATE